MKRIISILFALLCVCGCLRFAAAAAEEPPAVGQVQDVTTTLEDETTVSLQWSAVPEATGYKVAYYNEKTDKYKTLVTTTATRALLFSLERGKTYRLRVRAFRKDGGNVVWGEPSADAYAATAPGALRGLHVKDVSRTTVTLGWKQTKGATHYEVYLFDDAKGSFRLYGLSGHLQMTVKNLQPDRLYRFRVRPFRLDKGKYAPAPDAGETEETTDTDGLPHTVWQACKAYGAALNAAKHGGTYQLTRKKTVQTEKHSVSRAAFDGTVQNLMHLFSGSQTKKYSVKNGKAADGTAAASLLPPTGRDVSLTPNDVKRFSVEENRDGGYTLTLTLNEDVSLYEDGKTSRPTTLSRATGWLRFEKLDTTPIRLQSGKVFYDGAVLKLTLDQKGRAAALTTRVRAALKLDCYAASVAFDAAIAYDCKEQYRLQYNGT